MWLFHLLLSNGGLCVWNMSTCGMFFKDSLEAQYHAVPWLSGQHQVMVILVPVSTPPCLYTWNSCSPQHGGKGDYVLMYPFYPQFEVHTYGCYGCFKITGQTEIKVQLFIHGNQNSWQNERWTSIYLLTWQLEQKGLCLAQLTCCLDKMTVGCSLFVHTLCFWPYQLNSPSPLESLHWRTLPTWSVLFRSVSRQQNKQTKEKPSGNPKLICFWTLLFFVLLSEALSKQQPCSELKKQCFTNLFSKDPLFLKIFIVWDSGNEMIAFYI